MISAVENRLNADSDDVSCDCRVANIKDSCTVICDCLSLIYSFVKVEAFSQLERAVKVAK